MRNVIKGFILGVGLSLSILITSFTFATGVTVSELVNLVATKNKVNVFVNGRRANVENYIIDGRTYLQLREMTDLLGLDLKWYGDRNEASLSTKPKESSTTSQEVVKPKEEAIVPKEEIIEHKEEIENTIRNPIILDVFSNYTYNAIEFGGKNIKDTHPYLNGTAIDISASRYVPLDTITELFNIKVEESTKGGEKHYTLKKDGIMFELGEYADYNWLDYSYNDLSKYGVDIFIKPEKVNREVIYINAKYIAHIFNFDCAIYYKGLRRSRNVFADKDIVSFNIIQPKQTEYPYYNNNIPTI